MSAVSTVWRALYVSGQTRIVAPGEALEFESYYEHLSESEFMRLHQNRWVQAQEPPMWERYAAQRRHVDPPRVENRIRFYDI